MMLRRLLRAGALTTAGQAEKLQGYRSLSTPRTHFLYFHSLRPSDQSRFESFLELLAAHMRLVSYSEAVERTRSGTHPDAAFCVSVDDAFSSNIAVADSVEKFGGSACFFVPTGLIGANTQAEVSAFFRTPEHTESAALSWSDLEALKNKGHEIGSHTVTHPNIADLSIDQVGHELSESKAVLTERLGTIDHFAWPYGTIRYSRPDLPRLAVAAGYMSTASAIRGAHRHPVDLESHYLLRDHCSPEWPTSHNISFIANSSRAL